MLDLYNIKWYREDEDGNLLDFLRDVDPKECFTLTDRNRNFLDCRKLDILELYRRLYFVARPDDPIDYIHTPNTLIFQVIKDDTGFWLRCEPDFDTLHDVLYESVKRIAKGDSEKKEFGHLFPDTDAPLNVYEMFLDIRKNPEGTVWATDNDGKKHKFKIDESFRMRDKLYCILSPLNDDGSRKDEHTAIFYVDESEGEPILRRENDKTTIEDAYHISIVRLDAATAPSFKKMMHALDSMDSDDWLGEGDEEEEKGIVYDYEGYDGASVEIGEDGTEYEKTNIEDILTDDELPGPIHLMHDEGWNYDELLEEKIGILEHDGRLYLIGQPKRFSKTGRTFKRIAADGKKYEIPEYTLEDFYGLDLFSIDRKKETLRKLDDSDFIDTLLDEFLLNISGD